MIYIIICNKANNGALSIWSCRPLSGWTYLQVVQPDVQHELLWARWYSLSSYQCIISSIIRVLFLYPDAVGSSRKRISGSITIVRAIPSRYVSPLEGVLASYLSCEPSWQTQGLSAPSIQPLLPWFPGW